MDMGLIENTKHHYRRLLLRETVKRLEDNEKSKKFPSLLQALRFLKQAWDNVTAETIRNCFKEANFTLDDQVIFRAIYSEC